MGSFGRSSSQTPMIGAPATGGVLSLPSLQLPMAQVNALQGGMDTGEGFGGAPQQQPGVTISAGDVLGAGEQIAGLFSPGTGTAFDPGMETQSPAYQQQRAGERNLSTLGGSFLTPGGTGTTGAEESLFMGGGALLPTLAPSPAATIPPGTPGAIPTFGFGENPASATGGSPFSGFDASFGALDEGPTMAAPGGSAASALGQPAPQADLLGGGLTTLQGLLSLYGGAQSGDLGQLLGGGSQTLGGLSAMAPEQLQALSSALGLGAQGLGLAGSGLAGLGGAYGLYQGIEQGDPMQALMGASGLYTGAVPIINALTGTSLPTLSGLAGQALSGLGVNLGAAAAPAAGGTAGLGAGVTGAGAGGALGATAAPAGSGAALGSLGAGATAGIVAAPWAIGLAVDTINTMLEQAAEARKTKFQARQFERGLPTMLQDVQGAPGIASLLGENATPEQAAQVYQQLQTLQRNWQGGDPTGTGKSPGFEAIVEKGRGGAMGPSFLGPDQSAALMNQLGPSFQALDYGRLRAQDILQGAGMQAPPGGGAWAFTPETAARTFGSRNYYIDPESGSYTSGATELNPWLAANYQPYKGVSEQDLINAQNAGTIPWDVPQWSPQAQAALQGIQPGGLEAGLRGLFGGAQGPNAQGFNAFFTGDYQRQLAEQQASDPVLQQLQQFIQGTGGLTQNADQILAAIQQNLQGAPLESVLGGGTAGGAGGAAMAPQPAPATRSQRPGEGGNTGIDLYALLRQLGYIQ